jgi:phosphohistidine swiveling domain-containing protein
MQYWKAHPEMIEEAHVLSAREGGREVCIVMTKARNQTFSANLERTGGVFKEDAIVIDNVAIDRMSAIDLGIPQAVIDKARVITFAR